MGLLSKLLLLPIKGPFDGAMWVTQKVTEAAEQELNDPSTLRKRLKLLEVELVAGRITDDEYDAAEEEILMRLKEAR
ncbi:gas vesicle protein GvpG [Rhodobacter sp. KR11]|jgi:hypothetical protein|uniref:gas vesicle protein GvpG n=1 Tax=Rhodobacter sp. KR11 TaxID=2974588 RepID=UPI002221C701|nr:gas vesicle protein GvpG [Rhodobacter sp. KR11]MCW1917403.1 gas vesicle protein GvpG [Rhodobacter sp. KR11]